MNERKDVLLEEVKADCYCPLKYMCASNDIIFTILWFRKGVGKSHIYCSILVGKVSGAETNRKWL